jgi:hypothetical protein
MTFPRQMAALPRLLNPLVLPLTRHLPPLAVLHHKGRLQFDATPLVDRN